MVNENRWENNISKDRKQYFQRFPKKSVNSYAVSVYRPRPFDSLVLWPQRPFGFFVFTYLTVAKLTAVDARDTTTAACYIRREHVSAINNNIMSYMVPYYYNYRNRAAFKFVSKIEMRLRLSYCTEPSSVYVPVSSYYGPTTWCTNIHIYIYIHAQNVLPVSSAYRKVIFSFLSSSSSSCVFFLHAFSLARLI